MTGTSFPDFITSRRRELDFTLGDVASQLGVSPITVSNWSNGTSRPNPDNLVALADLLDVPTDELAEMAGVVLEKPDVGVNLMPITDDVTAPDQSPAEKVERDEPAAAAAAPVSEPAPTTGESPSDEPTADKPTADEPMSSEPAPDDEEVEIPQPEVDEVPIPAIDDDAIPAAAAAKLSVDDPPDPPSQVTEEPDSVPAFVSAAPDAEPKARTLGRPSLRRPTRLPAGDDSPVAVLPLTYVEDPKQLMRYRIRWALTVVVLVIMFFILLWASRELLSALSEVKQAVTPGGIGGG